MGTELELLIKAKADIDAAFNKLETRLKGTGDESKKANDFVSKLANEGMRQLGDVSGNLSGSLGNTGSFLTALGPAGTAAAVGIGAVVAVIGFAAKVSADAAMAAADYADRLAGLADKSSLSGEALQGLDVAAKLGNSSLEAVAGAVNKMQLALAKGSDGFRQMGLNIADLRKLSPEEQFAEVSRAILAIEDPVDRAAVGSKILGKSWGDLVGTMKAAASGASDLGGALSRDALDASADLKDQTDLLKEAWDRVQRQFGAAIASSPELRKGIHDLATSVASLATELAKAAPAISKFFDNFTNGIRATASVAKTGGGFLSDLFGGKGVLTAGANAAGRIAGDLYMEGMRDSIAKMKGEIGFGEKGKGVLGGKGGGIGPSDEDVAKAVAAHKKVIEAIEAENKVREHTSLAWDAFFKTLTREESDLTKWVTTEAKARTDARVKALAEEMVAAREAAADRRKSYQEMAEAMLAATDRLRSEGFDGLSDGLHQVVGVMELLGISSDSTLGKIAGIASRTADMLATAAKNGGITLQQLATQVADIYKTGSAGAGALSGAMTGFAVGGPIGAGIGAIGGALLGWAGKAKAAEEAMKKLRGEFVQGAGGMAALEAKAKAAGVSLDGMFRQKSAAALAHQIDTIKAKLADWADAQEFLKEQMDEFGITAAEMGKDYAGLELDKRAEQYAKAFAGLALVSGDASMVASKMGDKVLDLVAQYQAAGLKIPAALKPVLDAMLKNGQLVDENGVAYESLEAAGIQFGQTMEGAIDKMSDAVNKLMEVLARGFHIPINFDVGGAPSVPGGPGGGGHPPGYDAELPLAAGGILSWPRRVIAGEDGPEAYLPLNARTYAELGAGIAMAMSSHGGGGAAAGGVDTVVANFALGQRQLGRAVATVSRRRIGRVNPSGIRRN